MKIVFQIAFCLFSIFSSHRLLSYYSTLPSGITYYIVETAPIFRDLSCREVLTQAQKGAQVTIFGNCKCCKGFFLVTTQNNITGWIRKEYIGGKEAPSFTPWTYTSL